jgi:type IV secretory pathway TraG/TraD family ATPase VirD4
VRAGTGGALFFPYQAGQIENVRTLISAWMRLAITEAMEKEEGDQRLWLVVDELDALGAIEGLKDALARLRKFGGRCVLGFQSISQVSKTYGREVADTIVENCGNTLILRCSASDQGGTARFASKLIGDREVIHEMRSWSDALGHLLPTRTRSESLRIEPAVLASQIEQLPDLEGFLKLASQREWRHVQLRREENSPPRWRRPPRDEPEEPQEPAASSRPRGKAGARSKPARTRWTATGGPAPADAAASSAKQRRVPSREGNQEPAQEPRPNSEAGGAESEGEDGHS